MKLLKIMVLNGISTLLMGQSNNEWPTGWMGGIAAGINGWGEWNHAVSPNPMNGSVLGWTLTNYYTQQDCNAMSLGWRKNNPKSAYGFAVMSSGNTLMRNNTVRWIYAKALSESTKMGLFFDLGRVRFPEVTVHQVNWEWSTSYRGNRYFGVCWLQGNIVQNDWWRSKGQMGMVVNYSIGDETELQAGSVYKLYQRATFKVAVTHSFHQNWRGLIAYQWQPMQWTIGLMKSYSRVRISGMLIFSALPLPSLQQQGMYEVR
jgi:hypothetical protein